MDINQIGGKQPEQTKANFDIIIKTNLQKAKDEGAEPVYEYPCEGYIVIISDGQKMMMQHNGYLSDIDVARIIMQNKKLMSAIRLLTIMGMDN